MPLVGAVIQWEIRDVATDVRDPADGRQHEDDREEHHEVRRERDAQSPDELSRWSSPPPGPLRDESKVATGVAVGALVAAATGKAAARIGGRR